MITEDEFATMKEDAPTFSELMQGDLQAEKGENAEGRPISMSFEQLRESMA